MSWTELTPVAGAGRKSADIAPVTMSVTNGEGRQTRVLKLTVRKSAEHELDWWVVGQRVNVLVGDGMHATQLRVQPSAVGAFAIGKGGGVNGLHPQLRLPPLNTLAAGAHSGTAVHFTATPDYLEITLPLWARPAKPQTMLAVPFQEPPARQKGQPYVGPGTTAPIPGHPNWDAKANPNKAAVR